MEKMTLKVENATVVIGRETVFHDLTIEINGPGLTVIIGPNGAGKTTFFKAITGLIKPAKGKITVNRIDITGNPRKAGKLIAYMPQLSQVNREFPVTGREFIESSVLFRSKPPRIRVPQQIRERVERISLDLGIKDILDKPISELSGGQVQRLMMARTVIPDTPIMLLDEPISAIDPRGRMKMVEYIVGLSERKLILLTTHDPTLFKNFADKVIVFWRGIKSYGKPDEVLSIDVLKRIYGDMVIPVRECIHVVDSHAA